VSKAVILGRPVSGQFDSDPSPWLKALIAAALPVALFAAVVVQFTVVNRLPLPGGTGPDLVLLLVAAVAVSTRPMTALLTGFVGGLALDVAPPETHYAGEYALIFCLVGYFAAWIVAAIGATTGERYPWAELAVMAAAVVAGEAGKAGLGLMLSDPNVTGPAIRRVLPAAVLWDLLLTPIAFFLVTWLVGLTRPKSERAPRPEFAAASRLAAVFRPASAGAAPDLRLAGSGANFDQPSPARRVPRLRLAEARSKSLARTVPAGSGIAASAPVPVAGRKPARLNFGNSASALRAAGAAAGLGRTPKLNLGGRGRGKSADFGPPRGSQHSPGKGWIQAGDRPAITPPRSQRGPGKGWIRAAGRPRGSDGAAAGIGGSGITVAGRRAPSAGWLRTDAHKPAPAARRARPGKGWLRTSGRPRANWYSSGPSTGWVRRSRSKDRWRSRRRSVANALSGVRDLLPIGNENSGGRR